MKSSTVICLCKCPLISLLQHQKHHTECWIWNPSLTKKKKKQEWIQAMCTTKKRPESISRFQEVESYIQWDQIMYSLVDYRMKLNDRFSHWIDFEIINNPKSTQWTIKVKTHCQFLSITAHAHAHIQLGNLYFYIYYCILLFPRLIIW